MHLSTSTLTFKSFFVSFYAEVKPQNTLIMINTFIFKDELADDWTMDTEYPL